MLVPPALPLALALLAAAPQEAPPLAVPPADTPDLDAPQQPIDAQGLALWLGQSLGIASECATDRNLVADEAKAERLIDQAANQQDQDPIELEDRFHDAMAQGRDQVLDNTADCDQATQQLDKLEGRQPD